MRAELTAPVGVEPALEERAQDGGLHLRPVERGGGADGAQLLAGEGQRRGVVEEPAVEPGDPLRAEIAAPVRHQPEQIREPVRERYGIVGARRDQVAHDPARQEAGVLGEEAEQHAVEEVRHDLGVVPARLHRACDLGEAGGGGLRDLVRRLLRAQRLGLAHHGAEDAQRSGGVLGEIVEGDGVDDGLGVGEVGVDLDHVHVADDERGRVLKILAVVEQLAVGGGQIGVGALVLPAEVAALPDIGPALPAGAETLCARLKGVVGAGRRIVGRGHAQHSAEVDEVLLRRGALAAGVVLPLGREGGGGDAGRCGHALLVCGRAAPVAGGSILSRAAPCGSKIFLRHRAALFAQTALCYGSSRSGSSGRYKAVSAAPRDPCRM